MRNKVDIACGGVDNLVRHHDYTIAIAEAAKNKPFAHYWLHGEHLLIDGKKMSKSRGNIYYLNDLKKMTYSTKQIRFFLIHEHYRKRLNFTLRKLEKAARKLVRLTEIVDNLQQAKSDRPNKSDPKATKIIQNLLPHFEEDMNNDLQAKAAFTNLFNSVARLDKANGQAKLTAKDAQEILTALRRIDTVLQVIF
jgi:cysteinyl-tRNA synthetase